MPQITTFRVACRADEVFFYSGIMDDFRIYDVALSNAEIADVITGNAVGSPVLWYPFEGITVDSSGNENNARLVGPPEIVTGRFDNAFDFDGVDDYVEYVFPEEETFDAYTVALWVRADTLGQHNGTGIFNNNSSDSFQIDVDGGNPGNYRVNSPGESFGPVTTGWVHLAVSSDGTDVKLYYNGRYVSTRNNAAHAVFGRFTLGKNRGNTPTSTFYFDGTIDDVRIYDVALSGPEIAALYLEWKEEAMD